MDLGNRIKLVEPQAPSRKPDRSPSLVLAVEDIVRETLDIALECKQVLAAEHISKDQLLVGLVSSLVVARLQKARVAR
jgi:hypothetical protein